MRSQVISTLTVLATMSVFLYVKQQFNYQPIHHANTKLRCDAFVDFLRRTQSFSDLFLIDRTVLTAIHSGDFQPCGKFGSTPVWFGLLNSTDLSRVRSRFTPGPFNLLNFSGEYLQIFNEQIHIGIVKVENFGTYWEIAKTSTDPPRAVLLCQLTKFAFSDDVKLNFPADVDFFLWQFERSELLECNQTAAETVRKFRLAHKRSLTPVINEEKFKLLLLARDIFYESRKDAFLDGGTLLGWARECDVVADTTDLDMSLKSTAYDVEFEKRLITDKRVEIIWILGRVNDSLQLAFKRNGVKVDLFLLYSLNNESYTNGLRGGGKFSIQFVTPPLKGICSAVLRHELFFVPCNYMEFIKANYGPNWFIPHFSTEYVWDSSPKNIRPGHTWTKAEWPNVVRTTFN